MPDPDRFEVVLVSPRNPLNIGAAARAMANFGLARLTVVAPFEPHWREAKSAVGAGELLEGARKTTSLREALADCTLVLGTGTRTYRRPEQPAVLLADLGPHVERALLRGGRIGLVFGPEKHGLTRDDLALCHLLVEIPTHPRQPSMNLGQAVAVCLYELLARSQGKPQDAAPQPTESGPGAATLPGASPAAASTLPAAMHDLDRLAEVIAATMETVNLSPAAMRKANRHDLDLLLRRLALTRGDVRRTMGLFRRILRQLGA